MNLRKIPEIILVQTQIPENLGSVARAMLNFKLEKLRIVSPLFELDNEKILPLSAGADKVINDIKKFESFEESIKDFNVLVAVTNRIRAIKKPQIDFDGLHKLISDINNKVGLIFGPEKSGLDNNHISMSDFVLKINTNTNFSSLNLSHAVLIVSYEIMKRSYRKIKLEDFSDKEPQATKDELLNFYKILEKDLEETNFFLVKEREKIIRQKIRNIFNKLDLTSNDVATLLGIIKSLRKNNQK